MTVAVQIEHGGAIGTRLEFATTEVRRGGRKSIVHGKLDASDVRIEGGGSVVQVLWPPRIKVPLPPPAGELAIFTSEKPEITLLIVSPKPLVVPPIVVTKLPGA